MLAREENKLVKVQDWRKHLGHTTCKKDRAWGKEWE